jgi:hypothetical protein
MAIFIIGHGIQEAGDAAAGVPDWTVVPPNGSVTFFSESGKNLLMANGLAALEANSRANGYTYPGGTPIENYRLSPLADNERQLFETVQGNSNTLAGALYVGDGAVEAGARLCQSTACQDGVHQCGGLLQRFPGPIIVLACRGDGNESTNQLNFGTTDQNAVAARYEADAQQLFGMSWFASGLWLYQLASYDPANPRADSQVEAAYLLTNNELAGNLEKFNQFCEYFREIQSGNHDNIWKYIELYDSMSGADQYLVELEWDADNSVNAAVESVKHEPSVHELMGQLDSLLASQPSAAEDETAQ